MRSRVGFESRDFCGSRDECRVRYRDREDPVQVEEVVEVVAKDLEAGRRAFDLEARAAEERGCWGLLGTRSVGQDQSGMDLARARLTGVRTRML